jgi:exodeoxyribonuclease VIII
MNRDDYHADFTAVSRGMLSDFLDRRSVYHARYIAKTAPSYEPTKAMDIGTACHAALLEPHRWESLVAVYPANILAKVKGEVSAAGAASTNESKAFKIEQESYGRIVLKEADVATVKAMCESVLRSPVGKWLEAPGIIETPRYWGDSVSGLRCRCLPDWYSPTTGIMLDIKSTKHITPATFAKAADDMRYWLQASHYLDSIGGEGRFLFVAVESEWPFETVLYEYPRSDGGDSIDLEFADDIRATALRSIAECHESGNWSDSWSGVVNTIERRYSKKGKV